MTGSASVAAANLARRVESFAGIGLYAHFFVGLVVASHLITHARNGRSLAAPSRWIQHCKVSDLQFIQVGWLPCIGRGLAEDTKRVRVRPFAKGNEAAQMCFFNNSSNLLKRR